MPKKHNTLTIKQQSALKDQQHNINKAINHFLAHKQCRTIVNKILDNYGQRKGLTFGLFKKIITYGFKYPKHAYFLMKLLRSPTITDKLEAYLQNNYHHLALNAQVLNLLNNQKLINLLCEKYATKLNSYRLSKRDINDFIKEISSNETKDILPVLLKNTKKLLEINKYFNNNQLTDAAKETLKLLEKEPTIKKYSGFLTLTIKKWLLGTTSIINDNPIIKEILQLPNKPLIDLVGILLNSINKDMINKATSIYNQKEYDTLAMFMLQLIKSEHYKESSELIGFIASQQNKDFLNEVIAILIKYQPDLKNIIPNAEDITNIISNKEAIDNLINLIKNFKEGTQLETSKSIIKTATNPVILSIITKDTVGFILLKIKNWLSNTNNPTTQDILDLPDKPLVTLVGVLLHSINKEVFNKIINLYNQQDYYKLVIFVLNLIKSEHYKNSSELIGFISSKQNKTFLNQIIAILIKYQPNLNNIIPNAEDIATLISNKEGIDNLIHVIKNFKEGTKLETSKSIIKTAAHNPAMSSIIAKHTLGWMMGKLANWWDPNNTNTKKPHKH